MLRWGDVTTVPGLCVGTNRVIGDDVGDKGVMRSCVPAEQVFALRSFHQGLCLWSPEGVLEINVVPCGLVSWPSQ